MLGFKRCWYCDHRRYKHVKAIVGEKNTCTKKVRVIYNGKPAVKRLCGCERFKEKH